MNILGLGENIIEELLDRGLIKNIADLYELTNEDFESMKKNGKKFAQNLIDSINSSRSNDLYRLITGLGIRNIGVKAAKSLAKHFKNIDNLMNCELDEIVGIDDMGEIMAKSVYDFFREPQTIDLINRFKVLGINMEALEEEGTDNRFEGMTFVLTGSLEKYSRKEAEDIIEKLGGKTSSSVSKKTTYVIAGEDAGSKLDKAQKLGVPVITEEQFKNMINI